MSLTTRRALCGAMVFAIVENADTIVMNDTEELDSWCVILDGRVEVVRRSGNIEQLGPGDRSDFYSCILALWEHCRRSKYRLSVMLCAV